MVKADWGLFIASDSCYGCIKMKPVIKELLKDGYRIRLIDFHKDRDVANQHNVKSIPTLILKTNQGAEVKRWLGFVTVEKIKRFLNNDKI